MILHAKHANDRYKDIVIHIPDTGVVVLDIAFSKDIDSNISVNTGVKNKARIISIERIGKTFFTEKYQFHIQYIGILRFLSILKFQYSWIACFYQM